MVPNNVQFDVSFMYQFCDCSTYLMVSKPKVGGGENFLLPIMVLFISWAGLAAWLRVNGVDHVCLETDGVGQTEKRL